MKLGELYQIADRDNIFIADMKLRNGIRAFSAMFSDGECSVAIDYRSISSESEEVSIIAHELGHCETGSFYTSANYLEKRSRCEYRADKWAIKKLIPKDEMVSAISNGYSEVWQLAELFGVTEDYIKKAFWIYFDKIV